MNSPNVKKTCYLIGDSIINGINETGIKNKKCDVKIKVHSGATSDDVVDYVKPVIRKKPEKLIIHIGTNDLKKEIKTVDNIKQICDYTSSKSPNTEITLSLITLRKDDHKLSEAVKLANERLKKFANKNKLPFIDNINIDESCLSKGKLHLNRKGKSVLANNFKRYIN